MKLSGQVYVTYTHVRNFRKNIYFCYKSAEFEVTVDQLCSIAIPLSTTIWNKNLELLYGYSIYQETQLSFFNILKLQEEVGLMCRLHVHVCFKQLNRADQPINAFQRRVKNFGGSLVAKCSS